MEFPASIKENRRNIYRMLFFALVFTLLGLFFHEAGHYEVGAMYDLHPKWDLLSGEGDGGFKFAGITIDPTDACTEKKFYLGGIMMTLIYLLVLCLVFLTADDRWLKFAAGIVIILHLFILFHGISPEGDVSKFLELRC